MERRATLSVLSQSALNSKAGGASRISIAESMNSMNKPLSRMSMVPTNMNRKSSIMPSNSRPSIMAKNSSSIQLRGSIATRTDPRNITDKNFIGTSVRILLDYLTEHNYPQVISPKILTRPSSKDFNNIILFLFLQIDPNFKLTGKFEDEVIAMFKQLKYPYQISKTSLVAVGTPHTWPALLATILWMIELLSYDEEVITSNKKQELDFDPDDSTASEKAFYSYLHNSYQFFLSGDDTTCDDLESQFLATFDVQNNTIVNQIQAMDDRNAALELEILNIEKHHAILPELQHKKLDYIKDIEKFKSLIQQLKKHKEQLESKSSERHLECCRIEASIVGIQQEIEELKQTISTQELSPDDVRRMMEERERLESSLQSIMTLKTATQKRVWDAEDELRSKVSMLEESERRYASLAEELKLIPKTARNANSKDLSIEIDTRAKRKSDLIKGDIRTVIIPTLKGIRQELNENISAIHQQMHVIQDDMEISELHYQEMEQEKTLMESKLKRTEDNYRREKESFESSVSLYASELDSMESKLIRLRDTASLDSRLNVATRRMNEAQSTKLRRTVDHKRCIREMIEEIMEVVSLCASHREMVQEKLGDLLIVYRQKLEHLLISSGEAVTGYTPRPMQTSMLYDRVFDDVSLVHEATRQSHCAFDQISPIESNNAEDQDAMSYMSQDTSDCVIAANISHAAPELDPRRVISNLARQINKCAADDRNILDDSASCVEI